jgi:hypothetical protein
MCFEEESTSKRIGEIRVRSNICTDSSAVHLVPWVIARTYWPDRKPTAQQKEESAYLWPCSICKRRLYDIHEDGCDHHVCRAQGIISVAEARQLREERDEIAGRLG